MSALQELRELSEWPPTPDEWESLSRQNRNHEKKWHDLFPKAEMFAQDVPQPDGGSYSNQVWAEKLGDLVPVQGVTRDDGVWSVYVNVLPALALNYRSMAVRAYESDEHKKYEKLEAIADALYETAALHDIPHKRVPRLIKTSHIEDRPSKPCVVCGTEFEYKRSTAMYCSQKCRTRGAP